MPCLLPAPCLALLLLLGLESSQAAEPAGGVESGPFARIDQEKLLARIGAKDPHLVILDVRTPEEHAAGHIEGAVNIAYDQLPTRLAELDGAKQKDVVVYCRSGRRSELALQTLRAGGFERLMHLEGDMLAWEAARRPVTATAPPPSDLPTPAPPSNR